MAEARKTREQIKREKAFERAKKTQILLVFPNKKEQYYQPINVDVAIDRYGAKFKSPEEKAKYEKYLEDCRMKEDEIKAKLKGL